MKTLSQRVRLLEKKFNENIEIKGLQIENETINCRSLLLPNGMSCEEAAIELGGKRFGKVGLLHWMENGSIKRSDYFKFGPKQCENLEIPVGLISMKYSLPKLISKELTLGSSYVLDPVPSELRLRNFKNFPNKIGNFYINLKVPPISLDYFPKNLNFLFVEVHSFVKEQLKELKLVFGSKIKILGEEKQTDSTNEELKSYGIKKLHGNLTIEDVKERWPWLLKAKIKNAEIGPFHLDPDILVWYNGIWEDGIWEDGKWVNGIWEDGIWEDGDWYSGVWKKGKKNF